MKRKTTRGLILSAAIFLLMPVLASAQTADQSTTTVVATVNIYNAKIVSQSNNDFKISFDISNREGVQPQIKYGIDLVKQVGQDQSLVEEMVFPDSISLGTSETVSQTLDYSAPEYLIGDYQLAIVAKNENGLSLAASEVGNVKLSGSSRYVEIDYASCYLSVQNEIGNKKYYPMQGVDIKADENLVANCNVINHFDRTVAVVPKITNYRRSIFGKVVASDNNNDKSVIALIANKKKSISFIIPKAPLPQAYDVLVVLEENNTTVSNPVIFHYVLHGMSATIQNLRLDKDYYQKGDIAEISYNWTGSADNFFDSRLEATQTENISAEFSIQDSQKKNCADITKKEITANDLTENSKQQIAIISDCINPQITLVLRDTNNNILDQQVLTATSQKIEASNKNQTVQPQAQIKNNNSVKYLIIFIIILLIISLVLIVIKKRKNSSIILLFLIFSSLLFLSKGKEARADTFLVSGRSDAIFTVSLDKTTYLAGSDITAYGKYISYSCANSLDHITYIGLYASINGVSKSFNSFSQYKHFVAPSLPGSYQAEFVACVGRYIGTKTPNVTCGKHYIPYTVIVPTQTLTISKTGSGTISSTPAGISCDPTCAAAFTKDSTVTLTATPDTGSTFSGWDGACTGTGACSVVMSADKTVTGTFNLIPACIPDGTYTCNKTNTGNTCTAANCGKNIITSVAVCKDNPCGSEVANSLCGSDCVGTTQACPACGGPSWKEVAP